MLIQHSLLSDRPTVQHRHLREWKQRWLLAIASSSVSAGRRKRDLQTVLSSHRRCQRWRRLLARDPVLPEQGRLRGARSAVAQPKAGWAARAADASVTRSTGGAAPRARRDIADGVSGATASCR